MHHADVIVGIEGLLAGDPVAASAAVGLYTLLCAGAADDVDAAVDALLDGYEELAGHVRAAAACARRALGAAGGTDGGLVEVAGDLCYALAYGGS